ncbi:MAG: hypothetical protein JRC60_08830 [Deltaproteobacteria bacterium]|nr:hypothetical protein [Deltaproteobacteria bacterium]
MTYLRGATFEAVTGLAAIDDVNLDDDGNGAGGEPAYITETQKTALENERALRKINGKQLLNHFGIETLDKLPANKFKEALQLIKARPIPEKETPQEREPGEDDAGWMEQGELKT